MNLSKEKNILLDEALTAAYNTDCANGQGTYNQSAYYDYDTKDIFQHLKDAIDNDNVSIAEFQKMIER